MIEIDNSAAERALRGVAIGRRNYLFAGADSGGDRAAAIYSLIGTAKVNGIDQEAWLRHVPAHIAAPPSTELTSSCPGITPGSWPLPENTPLPSGPTSSSFTQAPCSRRC